MTAHEQRELLIGIRECALAHDPGSRLVGNIKASEIVHATGVALAAMDAHEHLDAVAMACAEDAGILEAWFLGPVREALARNA